MSEYYETIFEVLNDLDYFKMKIDDPLYTTLSEAKLVIKQLIDGEECDHNVGICYCDVYNILERIDTCKRKLRRTR